MGSRRGGPRTCRRCAEVVAVCLPVRGAAPAAVLVVSLGPRSAPRADDLLAESNCRELPTGWRVHGQQGSPALCSETGGCWPARWQPSPVACSTEVVAMLVPAIAEVFAGLIVLWLAIRMRQGRVPRGSAAGVRTPSTMRSDAAFAAANKAAAPLTAAGGAILAVCGVLAAALPKQPSGGLHLRRGGSLSRLVPPRRGDGRASLLIRPVSEPGADHCQPG